MHSPVRASEAVISLDRIRSLLTNASGRVEFYTPVTEHHLKFLSLKGGCRGSSKSTHVKMPHCWKSHVLAQIYSMMEELGWKPLHERRSEQHLILLYKIIYDLVAVPADQHITYTTTKDQDTDITIKNRKC